MTKNKYIGKMALLFTVALAFIFLLSISQALAANPGHSAASVSAGTFEAGNFTFPDSLFVTDYVGVGTSDPSRQFHLHDSSGNAYFQMTSSSTGSTDNDGFQIAVASQVNLINREAASIVFETDNSEKMRLTADGKLAVGTENPASNFHLNGTSSGATLFRVTNIDESTGAVFGLDASESGYIGTEGPRHLKFIVSNNELMRFTTNQKIGIGTINPVQKLDVNGSVNVTGVSAKLYSPEICLAGDCITGWSGATLSESEVEAFIFDADNTGSLTTTGDLSAAAITGTGVITGGTFDSGNGATEIYDMNQDLMTNDNVAFADVTATGDLSAANFRHNSGSGYISVGLASIPPDHSTVLGMYAGVDSGVGTTVIGYYAGDSAVNSQGLVAIGAQTAFKLSGENNTLVGALAGAQGVADSVDRVTGLGYYALGDSEGNNTLAVGYEAGRSNTGDNVVAIGFEAGQSNSFDSQFILHQANVNSIPLLQGNFSSGRLGVNQVSAAGTLDVNGTLCIQGDCISSWTGAQVSESEVEAYVFDDDNALASDFTLTSSGSYDINLDSNTLVVDTDVDRVGIGTTSPDANLDVSASTATLLLTGSGGTGTANLAFRSGGRTVTTSNIQNFEGSLANSGTLAFQTRTAVGSLTTQMFINEFGEVGIGTISPTQLLDVNGSINVSGSSAKLYSPEICLAGDCITGWSGAQVSESEVEAYVFDDDNALASDFNLTSDGSYDINFDSNTLVVDTDVDRVGIGVAAPSKSLEVSNGTQSLTIDPTASDVTLNTTGSSDLILTSHGGNVVIQIG